MSVSRRLQGFLFAGLAGANIVVCAVTGYSVLQSRAQHEERARTLTQNIAGALDQSISGSVHRVDLALLAVVDELERQLATRRRLDDRGIAATLARYEKRLPEVEAIRIAAADGRVIYGKGLVPAERASWADRDYFATLRADPGAGLQISRPRVGKVAKQHIVGFARAYRHADGRFAGVVSAPIALSHFTRLIEQFKVGARGTLILRDNDLGLVTRVPPIPDQPVGQVGNASVSKEFRALAASGVRASTYHLSNSPDGFERILTFRRLDVAPMIAIVGTDSSRKPAATAADMADSRRQSAR